MTLSITLPAVFVLAAMTLCSCSGTKKPAKGEGVVSKRLGQRLNAKWDISQRSSFEKQTKTAEGTNKTLKEGSYHTKEYHAKASTDNLDKKYKDKEYSQADKKDSSFEKTYSGSHETSKMGSEQFKTSESHFGDKKSQDADKSFSGGSEVFRTKEESEAAKAQKKNAMPKIINPSGKPSYTEDEVRGLLNKG